MVVRKQVKSRRKDKKTQILAFKKKSPYRVLEKATSSSYWLQSLPFCEGIGRPRIEVK